LHGQRLANLPVDVNQHPGREFLVWHNENQFQGELTLRPRYNQ
jgi:hypothetical protein